MRKYVFIAVGGILGAILRYLIKGVHIYHYHGTVPINTLIINISGSFILAAILTVSFEVWEIDANLRLGIATGFLGAYTTFSTLCKETTGLLNKGEYFSAFSYMAISIILGLASVYLGVVLAREVISKLIKKDKKDWKKDSEEIKGGIE